MSDIEKGTVAVESSDISKGMVSEFRVEEDSASYSASPQKKYGFLYVNPEFKIKRKLLNRHVQLIAMGGAIGTSVFVSIGGGLINAGPLGLLLGFAFWTTVVLFLTVAVGEMVCYLPVPSPFITMAGRVVDEAMEFTSGWNFYIMQALYIPFEITAVNGMIHFWVDGYSPAITLCVQIVLYVFINLFAVRIFGEVEFWLSSGKVILLIGLLFFTFVTMVGGNPQHDVYGFRNWHVEGGPINQYWSTGATGRFQAIISSMITAAFVCAGVEYMSMVASECVNPRKNMPIAFKTVIWRLVIFYCGGALAVGILVAYNDPDFIAAYSSASNAAASPYVVAMKNMGIQGLPSLVNAIIITAAFSAGNSFVYCSSRVLYGLSRQGFAPKFFGLCNKQGVPIFCVALSLCFSLLSLLQLGDSSYTVLNYMVNICTGSQVLNYFYMMISYIGFYRACEAQGLDRNGFTYKAWFQPYATYVTAFFMFAMICILGYTNFLPGNWSTSSFIFNYIMVFVNIFCFILWKVVKRTKFVKPSEADLVSGLDEIEEHEYEFYNKLKEEGKTDERNIWQVIFSWIF